MIEVKNLMKKYGSQKVVDNVNLKIEKEKITSFIGPNGAGKSTLLSMISRILDSNSGEIYLEGKSLTKFSTNELAKKLSILKQTNEISISLTVRDLVSFGRFPYSQGNLNDIDQKYIDEAISYMKLNDIENKFLNELSGGQRQRAFIAMVIAQDTEYILLDEPLNNLDVKHSVDIMKTLRRLVGELGKTVVIVMHDLNFTSCYSDYIYAFDKGKLVKEGGVKDIIDEEVLEGLYGTKFSVKDIEDCRICLYY